MSVPKRRRVNRKWNKAWEKKYFFIEGENDDSQCLICYQTVSEKKEGKLERHFSSKHKDYDENYPLGSQLRTDMFNLLQKGFMQHQLKLQTKKAEALTVSSSIISWEIVRHMKPFTDGEFIKDCMIKTAAQLFPDEPDIQRSFQDVQLSARTVAQRVDVLSGNIQKQLDEDIAKSQFISLALDEFTDIMGRAQLCIFIRYVFENSVLKEELLDLVLLPNTTTGQDISGALIEVLKKHNVPLDKISSIATDGAPSMVGKHRGAIALLRKTNLLSDFKSYHCLLHQLSLCAKHITVEDVMTTVVKIVNYIRTQPLQHGEFCLLLDEYSNEHGDLLLHAEVRWLSRGYMLKRFSECLPQILSFLLEKKKEFLALNNLPIFKYRLGYLTDITSKFNELNLALQRKGLLLCDMVYQIKSMKRKLVLFKEQLQNGDSIHFPSLRVTDENAQFCKEEMKAFAQNLHHVYEEMENRFFELKDLGVSEKLLCNPFGIDTSEFRPKEEVRSKFQRELLQLKCDTGLRSKVPQRDANGNYTTSVLQFWQEVHHEQFPYLKNEANRNISMLSTTCMCEQSFSAMKQMKSASRNCLLDTSLKNLLVATTTTFLPDFATSECK